MVYNALGDTDDALAALEDAVERRDARLILLNVVRKWHPLRKDKRFLAILRRLRFSN